MSFDCFFKCLTTCINLYTFEVYVFKISGLKHHKMTKLLKPKPGTRINKHPVLSHNVPKPVKIFSKRGDPLLVVSNEA